MRKNEAAVCCHVEQSETSLAIGLVSAYKRMIWDSSLRSE